MFKGTVQKYSVYSKITGISSDDDQTLSKSVCANLDASNGVDASVEREEELGWITQFPSYFSGRLLSNSLNFVGEREWDKFDQIRNLALALLKECGELSDLFIFKGDPEVTVFTSEEVYSIQKELADVTIYFCRLVYRLDCAPLL